MFTTTIALLAFGPADPSGPGPKAKPMTEQVSAYLSTEKWPEVFEAVEAWAKAPRADRARLARLLAPALTDVRRVGLRDTADLIIPYRIDKGELKFHGHGLVVKHDLFLAGGRAAWAIARLLDTEFTELHGGLTADQWAGRAADISQRVEQLMTDKSK